MGLVPSVEAGRLYCREGSGQGRRTAEKCQAFGVKEERLF